MNMKLSELELTKKVKNRLESIFDNFEVYEEVGVFNRNIDMLLLLDGNVHSIEFKIKDWKKAIVQLDDYMIVSDYTYLCMPQRKISKELKSILLEKGIGLLLYCDDKHNIEQSILPKPSSKKIDYYKYKIIDKITTHKELYRSYYA